MSNRTEEKVLSRLVAKAWLDSEFCQRLRREPAAVLQEAGLNLGDRVPLVIDKPSHHHQLTFCLTTSNKVLDDNELTVWDPLSAWETALICILCRACASC